MNGVMTAMEGPRVSRLGSFQGDFDEQSANALSVVEWIACLVLIGVAGIVLLLCAPIFWVEHQIRKTV